MPVSATAQWLRANGIQLALLLSGVALAWGSLNARVDAVENEVNKRTTNVELVPILDERQQLILNALNELKEDTESIKGTQQQILIRLGQ